MKRLEQESHQGELWVSAARVILDLGTAQGLFTVKSVMGQEWLQAEVAKRELRPINPSFVPGERFRISGRYHSNGKAPASKQD